MSKYQSIYGKGNSTEQTNGDANKKRKINDDDGKEQSGIAKLARFAKQ